MQYYTNLTKNDLLISDIGITIKAGQTVLPRQLNPMISDEQLHESESIGALYRAVVSKKLLKTPHPPKKETDQFQQKLRESDRPIPSRSRVGVAIDPKKKQYIEELTGILDEQSLSKFTDYADGFAEPELEVDGGGVLDNAELSAPAQPPSRYVDVKTRY
jgi:hypothetical protein